MQSIALLVVLLAADAAQRPLDSPLVLPPRDAHPFGAIETRPLWERPQTNPLTLQQQAEDALDRGTGRIEDEASFELRLLDRDRFARELDLRDRPAADRERYQLERDRQERIGQQRWRLESALRRQRRLEREADALADVRRRFEEQANRPNSALGAVVDRQALAAIEREYRDAVNAAAKAHASAIAGIDADQTLTAEQRAARRAAADQTLEQSRSAAARRWEARRKEVLGQK